MMDLKINPSTTDMDPVAGYGCDRGRGVFYDPGDGVEVFGLLEGPIMVHCWDKDNNIKMPLDEFKEKYPERYKKEIEPLLKNREAGS